MVLTNRCVPVVRPGVFASLSFVWVCKPMWWWAQPSRQLALSGALVPSRAFQQGALCQSHFQGGVLPLLLLGLRRVARSEKPQQRTGTPSYNYAPEQNTQLEFGNPREGVS